MSYTRKILIFLYFTQEKQVNRDIFGKNMRMEDVLLIYFEQFFPTQIQTKSTCFLKSYNISSLNWANYTEG